MPDEQPKHTADPEPEWDPFPVLPGQTETASRIYPKGEMLKVQEWFLIVHTVS